MLANAFAALIGWCCGTKFIAAANAQASRRVRRVAQRDEQVEEVRELRR